MAWQQVASYSFGFNTSSKKFWMYYTLKGANTTTQVFLTPTQFSAIVAAFNSATSIQYEDSGHYFSTAPRQLP
jgi:hypothetical protein